MACPRPTGHNVAHPGPYPPSNECARRHAHPQRIHQLLRLSQWWFRISSGSCHLIPSKFAREPGGGSHFWANLEIRVGLAPSSSVPQQRATRHRHGPRSVLGTSGGGQCGHVSGFTRRICPSNFSEPETLCKLESSKKRFSGKSSSQVSQLHNMGVWQDEIPRRVQERNGTIHHRAGLFGFCLCKVLSVKERGNLNIIPWLEQARIFCVRILELLTLNKKCQTPHWQKNNRRRCPFQIHTIPVFHPVAPIDHVVIRPCLPS